MEPQDRDENQENILEDMIRGGNFSKQFLNDSGKGDSTEETARTPGARENSAAPMREKPTREKPAAPVKH